MIDKNFFHLHRKAGHRILLLLGTVAFVLFVLAVMAIHGAAHLFNKAMEEQTLLRGTIEVETISADIMGNVHFTALQWHDPEGNLILYVPDGSLTVRPWDILRRSFRSTTISDITLNDATIAAYLHKDKHWDIIEPQKGEQKKPQKQPRSYGERIRNINWNGQKIDASIHLNNCRLEAYYSGRAYAMEAVHAAISARTGKKSTIHVTTGRFNGDAIGDGIAITGALNLQHEVPTTDLHVSFVNVDPSSLGFGNAIHDKMTLKLHITGPLDNPTGKGSITMDQLELPALQFTDIHGDVSYAKDTLTFSDVHAKVYGGTLDAYGTYTIPTRAYTIHGEGHDLSSSTALRDFKFRTKVSMTLTLSCDGDPTNLIAYGTFQSGKGMYFPFHFDSISGRFHNKRNTLDFYDVVISTSLGTFTTDALHIDNDTIVISPIHFKDPSGASIFVHQPDEYKNQQQVHQQIKNNLSSMKQSISSIHQSMKSIQQSMDSLGQ